MKVETRGRLSKERRVDRLVEREKEIIEENYGLDDFEDMGIMYIVRRIYIV